MRANKNTAVKYEDYEDVGSILSPETASIARFKPDYFTDIIFWEQRSTEEKRTKGQYRFGTATAELTWSFGGKSHGYKLDIRFVKLEDGQRLYTLIRAGKIAPFTSYEEVQQANAIRHFIDLWREFWMLVRTSIWEKIHRLKTT